MRQERSVLIDNFCKESGGNLATPQIFPERVFSTLSSGEKRRLLCLLSLKLAATQNETKLIILDEPFAHLDPYSIQSQTQTLLRIQELAHSPALLVISHLYVDELAQQLSKVQILTL